jgi:hypothetical protein
MPCHALIRRRAARPLLPQEEDEQAEGLPRGRAPAMSLAPPQRGAAALPPPPRPAAWRPRTTPLPAPSHTGPSTSKPPSSPPPASNRSTLLCR